jgi:hypothetical protein
MRRILSFLLVLAAAAAFAAPANLLNNPGFEKGTDGWNNWGGSPTSTAKSGAQGLVISQTTAKWAGTDQRVALAEGSEPQRVTLSGWMKTEGVVKNANPWEMARFVLNFYDAAGQMVGGYQESAAQAQGDTDWTRYEKTYTAPPGTRQIEVQCALGNCTGTAIFDDMVLTAFDASGKALSRGVVTGPADEGEWYEFKAPAEGEPGHYVDWSGLLDAPAGKHGFVRAKADGTLAFEDGTPVRFWGTNLVAGNCFPDAKTAEATALRLSRMGCNLVRLHHMDAPWFNPNIFCNASTTRRLCPDALEKLDYLVYCLKQKGIYVYMDLLVHRDFLAADGVTDRTPDLGGKQVGLFSRKLIDLQKEYAAQLLTHVNPHTKTAYKDEPAVAGSEFINESTIFMHFGGDILNEPYRKELEGLWRKAGNQGKLSVFTQDYENCPGCLKERTPGDTKASVRFLADLEWRYFAEMRDHLRRIGVRYPLSGSNWAPTLATIASDARLDTVINNNYWDHPQLWKMNNDWSRVLYAPFDNLSQMRSAGSNSVFSLAYGRVKDKPYLVTEWNDCFPNEYRLEGVPFMAAYAALQGWNGFLQFDFDHSPAGSSPLANFTLSKMPDHLAQWVVAAPMFLRGDVKTAPGMVVENVTAEQRLSVPSWSSFLKDRPWLPYVTRYAKGFDDAAPSGAANPAGFERHFDKESQTMRSETGELLLDSKAGSLRVETPRLQGVQGAVRGKPVDLPALRVELESGFASAFLVSADGQPLSSSKRMYLVCVGAVKQTGTKYGPDRKQLEEPGALPLLAQVVKGTVLLKGAAATVRPLSVGGKAGKALKVAARDGGTLFDLSQGRTFVYEITPEK